MAGRRQEDVQPDIQPEPNEPAQEHIWAVYERLSQWVAEMEAEQQEEEEAA